MKIETIEKIREVAHLDQKTPVQAALKLVEEIGELARLVLIKDGAHGTTYRPAPHSSLLEEAADVLICTFALLEKLDLSDASLEPHLVAKIAKWRHLISDEPS